MAKQQPRLENVNELPQKPRAADPRVTEFLESHVELQRRFDAMCQAVDNRDRTIAQLQDRCTLLDRELDRATFDRDQYMRGFFEMKAQLAILSSQAQSACNQVSVAAERAIESTRAAMEAAGLVEASAPPQDIPVETMKALDDALQLAPDDDLDRRVPRMVPDDEQRRG